MKSLVATTTLVVLVFLGVLIYEKSVPQVKPLEQVEVMVVEEAIATTTEEMATTTATTTEGSN